MGATEDRVLRDFTQMRAEIISHGEIGATDANMVAGLLLIAKYVSLPPFNADQIDALTTIT